MPYSVPVSDHIDECSSSVINDELDSLLDCIPKKVSEVSREKGLSGLAYLESLLFKAEITF